MKKLIALIIVLFAINNIQAQHYQINSVLTDYQVRAIQLDGVMIQGYLGSFTSTFGNVVPNGYSNPFISFCGDVGLSIDEHKYYGYEMITDPNNIDRSRNVPSWSNKPLSISLGEAAWVLNQYMNDPDKSYDAAAGAHLAILECLYDDQINIMDGRFKLLTIDTDIINKFDQYTDNMNFLEYSITYWQRQGLDGEPQSLLSLQQIPEPSTLLILIGFLTFITIRKNY